MEIPFALHSYLSQSNQVSRQRLVNCALEKSPQGAKSQIPIFGTPGIASFATVGSGPMRGGAKWQEKLYVVSGEELYRVNSDGTSKLLGALPGTDRVSIALGENLIIATHENAYAFDGQSINRVADSDFKGASQVGWLAGYTIYLKPKTGVFFISRVGEPTQIDPLDFATAESKPDNVIALLTDSINMVLFGRDSTEVWGLRGGAFPFIRHSNGVLDVGCGAAHSPAKLDNIAFWLADDLTVRMMDQGMQRISTEGVEHEIAGYTTTDDAVGMTSTVAGRATYILTFPTEGKTWQYSLNTGLWNELESFDKGRWRGDWVIEAHNRSYVLEADTNKVGYLTTSTFDEFGEQTVAKMVSAPVANGNKWLFHKGLYLDFETGGVSSDDAEVMVRWSDDGFNWGPVYSRSLGRTGQYADRVSFNQSLGRAKNRVYEVSISDPVKRYFLGAEGEISLGGY